MAGKSQLERPSKSLEEVAQELNKQMVADAERAKPLDTELRRLTTEELTEEIACLTPLANATIAHIMRNPDLYPSQAVAAAKIVFERTLGAVPDTVIQNNMQFIVKWED